MMPDLTVLSSQQRGAAFLAMGICLELEWEEVGHTWCGDGAPSPPAGPGSPREMPGLHGRPAARSEAGS